MPFGGADLHFHSTFSDGVETPAELVPRAVAAGLSVAALTDHDAVHGVAAFEAAAAGTGLVAAGGAELSVDDGGEDVHLLGLFVDPEEPSSSRGSPSFREVRDRRGEAIVGKLAALGVTLDLAALRAEVGDGAFGRPHVARALVAKGVVASVGGGLRTGTSATAVRRSSRRRSGDSRRRSGPSAGPGASRSSPTRSGTAIRSSSSGGGRDLGLDGVEVFHPDNDGREEELGSAAEALGLLVTAGSDFHSARGRGAEPRRAAARGDRSGSGSPRRPTARRRESAGGLPRPRLRADPSGRADGVEQAIHGFRRSRRTRDPALAPGGGAEPPRRAPDRRRAPHARDGARRPGGLRLRAAPARLRGVPRPLRPEGSGRPRHGPVRARAARAAREGRRRRPTSRASSTTSPTSRASRATRGSSARPRSAAQLILQSRRAARAAVDAPDAQAVLEAAQQELVDIAKGSLQGRLRAALATSRRRTRRRSRRSRRAARC